MLPRVSGQECIKALVRVGFVVVRQQGSHIVVRRGDPFAQLVVPDHKELDRGTFRAIIRQAGMTVEEFVRLV
ncbi:MAG: type II toxin-antitoxin system HicA family toxin [Chloroflexota bacterium]|nr:type II toxin-antitoxin system HicA family toxin [Chloroflexota bacterium]